MDVYCKTFSTIVYLVIIKLISFLSSDFFINSLVSKLLTKKTRVFFKSYCPINEKRNSLLPYKNFNFFFFLNQIIYLQNSILKNTKISDKNFYFSNVNFFQNYILTNFFLKLKFFNVTRKISKPLIPHFHRKTIRTADALYFDKHPIFQFLGNKYVYFFFRNSFFSPMFRIAAERKALIKFLRYYPKNFYFLTKYFYSLTLKQRFLIKYSSFFNPPIYFKKLNRLKKFKKPKR